MLIHSLILNPTQFRNVYSILTYTPKLQICFNIQPTHALDSYTT